jgi:hypothetical protein
MEIGLKLGLLLKRVTWFVESVQILLVLETTELELALTDLRDLHCFLKDLKKYKREIESYTNKSGEF